jgi:hypothetical protein
VNPGIQVAMGFGLTVSAVSKKSLEYYLDKYTFRFYLLKPRSQVKLSLCLIEEIVVTAPVTCDELIRLMTG